jgi:anaerobic dimethyl sulfoxide reductase subunit C
MDLREWALILFTILTQTAVGAFVVLGIVHAYVLRKAGADQASRLSDRALYAIGPVVVLGMLASFGHLGNPLNAPRAIANLGSSWLSREIFFSVLFAGLGAVFALMQWRKISTFAVRNLIAWAAALVGLVSVYAMAQVYMLENQPAWNTWATPIAFFATAFLLGSLAMGAAFVVNYNYLRQTDPQCAKQQCDLLRSVVKGIAVAAIAFLGVQVLVTPLHLAYLAASGVPAAMASAAMVFDQFAVVFALRLVLVFVGAGVFGLFLYRAAQAGSERSMGNLLYGAFALVLASEMMGRFLFYATHVSLGL